MAAGYVPGRRQGVGDAVGGTTWDMEPVQALLRIAFLLERDQAPSYRVRAFRTAARSVGALDGAELRRRVTEATLSDLPGVGPVTAGVVTEAVRGSAIEYLRRLESDPAHPLPGGGGALRAALRGDLHAHSDWSDGGSPIAEMAATARDLGHEYLALTDHSPRLTVARGLSGDRLRAQLDVVAELNRRMAPFRVLSGIEVDILEDGSLDQDEDLLAALDVVVASVHSHLRMRSADMTARMVTAVSNPHVDVLGHCTGRLVPGSAERGRARPESRFDADTVFVACRRGGVAVEVNSRPERLDPPRRLLRLAAEMGCLVAVDSDAHAPGQLDWLAYGCSRAVECGVPMDSVVNTRSAETLGAWTLRGEA